MKRNGKASGRKSNNSGVRSNSKSPLKNRNRNPRWNPIALFAAVIFALGVGLGAIKLLKPTVIFPPPTIASCNPITTTPIKVNALTGKTVVPFSLSISPKAARTKEYMPVKINLGNAIERKIGPSIIASGNLAAVMSSVILAKDLGQCEFTLTIDPDQYTEKGEVIELDGPSAGALFTSGFISIMLGDKIPENTAMTGTINPDGTVGFVGDIPEKLIAINTFRDSEKIRDGFKVVIPEQNEENIDIAAKGKQLVRVASIYDAYKELTDKTLPRYFPDELSPDKFSSLSKQDLQIDNESAAKIEAEIIKTGEIVNKYKSRVDASINKFPSNMLNVVRKGQEYFDDYNAASGKGDKNLSKRYNRINYSNAYYTASEAYLNNLIVIIDDKYLTFDEKINKIRKLILSNYSNLRQTTVPKLEKYIGKDINDLHLSSTIDAYTSLARIKSYIDFWDDKENLTRAFKESNADNISSLLNALAIYGLVMPELINISSVNTKLIVDIGKDVSKKEESKISRERADRMFSIFSLLKKGGDTNLDFIKAYVNDLKQAGIKADLPIDYYLAYIAREKVEQRYEDIVKYLDRNEQNLDPEKIYEPLGYAVALFIDSSILVQKYYSLQVVPQYYNVISELSPQNKKNLTDLLDFAKTESQVLINLLKEKTLGNTVPVFNYLQADSWRDSTDLQDRFYSVSGFWDAILESRLTLLLSR